jgi:hypothetical protein
VHGRPERCLGEDDRELLAADPRGEVRRPHLALDRPRERLEHAVAGLVAVGVVEPLEVVEVDHDERERAPVAARPRDLLRELAVEVAPVGEPRERVGERDHDEPRPLLGELRGHAVEGVRERPDLVGSGDRHARAHVAPPERIDRAPEPRERPHHALEEQRAEQRRGRADRREREEDRAPVAGDALPERDARPLEVGRLDLGELLRERLEAGQVAPLPPELLELGRAERLRLADEPLDAGEVIAERPQDGVDDRLLAGGIGRRPEEPRRLAEARVLGLERLAPRRVAGHREAERDVVHPEKADRERVRRAERRHLLGEPLDRLLRPDRVDEDRRGVDEEREEPGRDQERDPPGKRAGAASGVIAGCRSPPRRARVRTRAAHDGPPTHR